MPAMKPNCIMKMIPILGILALFFFPPTPSRAADWLIDPSPFRAAIVTNAAASEIVLQNGLLRRVFKLEPDAATVALDNLMTGEAILRSVRPEAQVQLDGENFDVGGLVGQPVHNYLDPAWLSQMKANPAAFHFAGLKTGRTEPRFAWRKRSEWLSQTRPGRRPACHSPWNSVHPPTPARWRSRRIMNSTTACRCWRNG